MDEQTPLPISADLREQQYDHFVTLLAGSEAAIRRFVRMVMPSADGVDDVVQETALECWKKFSEFQPAALGDDSDEFVRWACVIARFKALSWQRDRARDRLVFRESVIDGLSRSALDSMGRAEEERQAIEKCLAKLSANHRRLVLSVHSPGESVARIAMETGEKARRLYSKINSLRTVLIECVSRQLATENSNG